MATLRPFRALRPRPAEAARIAAVPYDVVNTDEARALAEGNPLSFLRVSRAEIELPAGTDPHSEEVYERAAQNFAALRQSALVVEDAAEPLPVSASDGRRTNRPAWPAATRSTSTTATSSRSTSGRAATRKTIAPGTCWRVGAQTGPVFLTYRARAEIDRIVAEATKAEPLVDFEAADGVRHTLWRLNERRSRRAWSRRPERIPALYIADGHHRAASAARARTEMRERRPGGQRQLGDGAGCRCTFLAVAFPDNQVQILPYNRVVKDLGGLSPAAFLEEVRAPVRARPGTGRAGAQG